MDIINIINTLESANLKRESVNIKSTNYEQESVSWQGEVDCTVSGTNILAEAVKFCFVKRDAGYYLDIEYKEHLDYIFRQKFLISEMTGLAIN